MKTLVICTEGQQPKFATDYDVFNVLQSHHPGPVLPNLARLNMCENDKPEIVFIFVQPTLREARFSTVCTDTTVAFLKLIETHVPKLEKLEIAVEDEFAQDVCDAFSKTICALRHLKRLDFAHIPLPPDVIVHLSALPELRVLSLELTKKNANAPSSLVWGRFPKLTVLDVLTYLPDAAIPALLLSALDGRCLTTLNVTMRCRQGSDRVTSLEHLFTAIGNLDRLTSCSLIFSDPDLRRTSEQSPRVAGAVLAPLARLSRLQTFTLDGLPVALGAADVRRLAAAWPALRRLELVERADAPPGGSVGLRDLAVLAAHCPRLERLAVRLRAVADGWAWHPGAPAPRPSLLSSLVLYQTCGLPRSALQDIVEFLAHTFCIAYATCRGLHCGGYLNRAGAQDEEGVVSEICKAKNERIDVELAKRLLRDAGREVPAELMEIPH